MRATVNLHATAGAIAETLHRPEWSCITFKQPNDYGGVSLFVPSEAAEAVNKIALLFNEAMKEGEEI